MRYRTGGLHPSRNPDPRLDKLAEIWETDKKTPAIVEFVDIAGLVKGASQGAGLGNKFLGHIRECDAIVHVVRCFDDDNIIHVVEDVNKPESVDPIRDIDAIDLELILAMNIKTVWYLMGKASIRPQRLPG